MDARSLTVADALQPCTYRHVYGDVPILRVGESNLEDFQAVMVPSATYVSTELHAQGECVL